jgi:hypothetical protein
MAYYGSSAYEEERKKNTETNFNLGFQTNPSAAAGQPIKPTNRLTELTRYKPGVSPDVSAPKSKPKKPMSRNKKNLLRRQGRD